MSEKIKQIREEFENFKIKIETMIEEFEKEETSCMNAEVNKKKVIGSIDI